MRKIMAHSIKSSAVINQRGRGVIQITCLDENRDAVTPLTCLLTVQARDGKMLIYRRSVTPTSSVVRFPLDEDDTDLLSHEDGVVKRFATIEYTYNSDDGAAYDVIHLEYSIRSVMLFNTPLEVEVSDGIFIGEYFVS